MAVVSPSEPSQPQPAQVKDSVISANPLTKKFGDGIAIQDVSFDIPGASIFGFIGPRGSGKTTTVRLLTGVYTPMDGRRLCSIAVQPSSARVIGRTLAICHSYSYSIPT